jgi:hypothetical protein
MASFIYNSFLADYAQGNINPVVDVLKVMLVTSLYTENRDIHTKRSDIAAEIVGSGYVAGGKIISVSVSPPAAVTDRATVTFGSVSWPNLTAVVRKAVIYKSRGGLASADELVAVIDFGSDQTLANQTLTLSGLQLITTLLDQDGLAIEDAPTVTPGVGDFIPYLDENGLPRKFSAALLALLADMPELIRDTVFAALVGAGGITVTQNDGADTITITGGGGGGETSRLAPRSGAYIGEIAGTGSADFVQDRIYYVPLIVTTACSLSHLATMVHATGAANAKLGLYSPDAARLPSARVALLASPLSLNTGGLRENPFSANQAVSAGLYYIGIMTDSGAAQGKFVNVLSDFYLQNGIGSPAQYAGATSMALTESGSYASGLPATATPVYNADWQVPVCFAKVA